MYAADLQDSIVKYNSCNDEIDKKGVNFSEWKTFLELYNEKHIDDSFAFETVFDNVALVLDSGHIEINLTRFLLSLLWEPFRGQNKDQAVYIFRQISVSSS